VRRFILVSVLALVPAVAWAQQEQQAVVDRATLTVEEMLGVPNSNDRLSTMQQARAVMICPRVFRAGFIFGGSGGDCVLAARDGSGSWSDPAFFRMGSASFGLQAGIQDAEVIMMILTERGLGAIMDSAFKIGGDAQLAVATVGAGVEGSTTAALRADIVAFTQARGLFAAITLNGGLLSSNTEWNRAYYGQDFAARQIVLQMAVNNPGADPLRAALTRFGGPPPAPRPYAQEAPYPRPYPSPPAYPGPTQLSPGAAQAPVQQQSLPPPR